MKKQKLWSGIDTVFAWLASHPMVWSRSKEDGPFEASHFADCLSIEYVRVNPKTKKISKKVSKNTQLRCRLEFGPVYFNSEVGRHLPSHDPKLGVGARSFEKALKKLAKKVLKNYGDSSVVTQTH